MMTKVKLWAGLLAVGAVVAFGWHFLNPGINGLSDHNIAVLKVTFTPSPRKLPVVISWFIDRDKSNEMPKDSPWVTSIPVRKGSLVTLGAIQGEPGALSCSIVMHDLTYGPVDARPIKGGACQVMALS